MSARLVSPGFDPFWCGDHGIAPWIELYGWNILGRYKLWGPDLVTHATVVESADDFSAGDWTPAQVTTPGANEIRSTTDDDVHKLTQTLVNAVGPVDSLTLRNVKPVGSQQWIKLRLNPGGLVYFDVINGVVGTETGATGSVAANVDGGWDVTTVPAAVATASAEYEIYLALGDGTDSGVGSASDGITLDSAEINQTSILTAPNDPTLAARNLALYGDPYHYTNPNKASQLVVGADVWDGLPGAVLSGANWIACDEMAGELDGDDQPVGWALAAQLTNLTGNPTPVSLGNSATSPGANSHEMLLNSGNMYLNKRDAAGSFAFKNSNWTADTDRHVIAYNCPGTVRSFAVDGVATLSGYAADVGNCVFDRFLLGARACGTPDRFTSMVARELVVWKLALDAQSLAASNLMPAENPL